MISLTSLKEERTLETYQPRKQLNCLVVTMRFEPKMTPAVKLESKVARVSRKAEKLLSERYAGQQLQDLLMNLQQAFQTLNYHTFKKSVAIFVSSDTCKVLYLNYQLDEAIYFTAYPDVADILHLQPPDIKYLVLVLNNKWSKTYLGTADGLQLIKVDSQRSDNIRGAEQYTGAGYNRSLCFDTSNDFQLICNAYELPVFVVGSISMVNHFSKMLRSSSNITQVIYRDTDTFSEAELFEELKAYFNKWNLIRQRYLQFQIEEAIRRDLFMSGANLLSNTNDWDCKLLIIEEGELTREPADASTVIDKDGQLIESSAQAETAWLIEHTLVCGGRVEIVPDGFLKKYDGLVMISGGTENPCIYEHLPAHTGPEIFW